MGYLCSMDCPESLSSGLDRWIAEGPAPFVIAGPCAAESREQVLETARSLATIPAVRALRAGVWKPRTRPDGFQGVGQEGLEWLREAGREYGLNTAVEVATPTHVEEALRAGIDMLWIGARTTGNPFSMQEIAESLSGVHIPVMVKNPLIPDLNLWTGALERLQKAGIRKLAAIHRGFYPYLHSRFRHDPMWEIPIELKRHCSQLPILCDPSHIAGKAALIPAISQKAMDLDMDGLMVEVHPRPAEAWTDREQQISPATLHEMIGSLVIRSPGEERERQDLLKELRQEIDALDHELIRILKERGRTVRKIGQLKKEHGMTVLQIRRWTEIIEDRLRTGEDEGIDRHYLMKLLQLIHEEAIRLQEEIMKKEGPGGPTSSASA